MPSRTSGAEGGPGKRIGSNPNTAPRSDPYITGSRNSHIATLVERHSRFVLLVKVVGKDTENVIDALINYVNGLPIPLMSTLTWDRGTELAAHARFTRATKLKVFFADPHSPGSGRRTRTL